MGKSSVLIRHNNARREKREKKKKKEKEKRKREERKEEHICRELPPDLLKMSHFKYFMLNTKILE